MKNTWFKIFFLVSIFFLVFALYRADYLRIPQINNLVYIYYSLIFLFLGFVLDALSWTVVLKKRGYSINYSNGITSSGISIFGKYIPGKLWVILGRSEYISNKYKLPRTALSSLSLNTQFISLWVSFLFGTIGLVLINQLDIYGILAVFLFVVLTIIIYTPIFHNLFKRVLFFALKKDISIPQLNVKDVLKVLPWFILYWISWSISFYFLGASLLADYVPINISWGFPLAATLGMLAIFAPGGLGVREGVLTVYLIMTGLEANDAATIAVVSRLWFLIGEVFIFLLALLLKFIPNTEN